MKGVLSGRKITRKLASLIIFLIIVLFFSCSSNTTKTEDSLYYLFDDAFSQLFPVLTTRIETAIKADSAGSAGSERGRISPVPSLKASAENLMRQWTQKEPLVTVVASPLVRKLIFADERFQNTAVIIAPFIDAVYDYDSAYGKMAESLANRLNSIQKKEQKPAVCGILFQENFMRHAGVLAQLEERLRQKAPGASLIIKRVTLDANMVDTDTRYAAQFDLILKENPDVLCIAIDHPELVARWSRDSQNNGRISFFAADASGWGNLAFDMRLFNLTIQGNEKGLADAVMQKARAVRLGKQGNNSPARVKLLVRKTWFRK